MTETGLLASFVRESTCPSVFPPAGKVAEMFDKSQVSVDVRNESQVRCIYVGSTSAVDVSW